MKQASDTDAPATKKKVRRRKFDVLMEKREATLAQRAVPASREAQYQERVRELAKRGQAIDGTHLADMAKALLEKDLVHPPRDSRTRIQIARAGLEAGGLIGPRSTFLDSTTLARASPSCEACAGAGVESSTDRPCRSQISAG